MNDNTSQSARTSATLASRGVSYKIVILIIVISAAIGYTVGTRSDDVMAVVAPWFGVEHAPSKLDLRSVQKTYQTLQQKYDGKLDSDKLIVGASKGLTAAVDDAYTVYFDKAGSKQFSDSLDGNIGGGIGAEIGLRSSQPTIVHVLDGEPAKKAGVKDGDTIVGINDDTVIDQSVDEVVTKIRGKVGTTVKLNLKRGDKVLEFNVKRQEIVSPSVEGTMNGQVGILTISRFDETTGQMARSAAQKLQDKGAQSIVLDLRDNGGGFVTAARDVASLWLKDKVIVSERRGGKTIDTVKAKKNPVFTSTPTVVLVNGGTASAAEIVAGALHDHNKATLVGEKTFGKGSVQDIVDMGRGNTLKVTIAKWYTPKGKNINGNGITPDSIVKLTANDVNSNKDPQLKAALKELK